jgi:hypothetical protein
MDGILHGFIIQALLTAASFAVGYLWNKSKALSDRQQAIEKGTRALLKIELRKVHRESKSRGFITYEDESIAEEVYEAYHQLGGNGQGTAMLKDLRDLETK